jgi:hypothetical protein
LCASTLAILSPFALGQPNPPSPDKADAFFHRGSVEDLNLWLHPDDWQKLRDNYLSNDYYPALFTWRDHQLEPIGIRSRGRGSRNPEKPGLRIDFNRYEDIQFLGLNGLVLDNMTQDPPQMRESTAMALYRRMGVPSPRCLYVRLIINGEPSGLYLAEEEIGKPFLRRHFLEDNGDLFEYSWADAWHWERRGDTPESYVPGPFEPKTKEKKPNAAEVMDLVSQLNATDPERADEALADLVDWDEILRFLAVDWYVGDFDGFSGTLGTNNFYLYRSSADRKWRLLPWDKDATFVHKDYPLFPLDETGIENRWITIVRNNPRLLAKYYSYCREIADEHSGWLAEQASLYYETSRAEALADPLRPWDAASYEVSIEEFFYFLRERSSAVLLYLDAAQLALENGGKP